MMRELTLRVECPQITVNGHTFDLRMNDVELYTNIHALFTRLSVAGAEAAAPEDALLAIREAVALLEAALGEGAAARIGGGKPVSLPLVLEWLGALAAEAAEHFVAQTLAED